MTMEEENRELIFRLIVLTAKLYSATTINHSVVNGLLSTLKRDENSKELFETVRSSIDGADKELKEAMDELLDFSKEVFKE